MEFRVIENKTNKDVSKERDWYLGKYNDLYFLSDENQLIEVNRDDYSIYPVTNGFLRDKFYQFLKERNLNNVVCNLEVINSGFEFDILDGDWKHEHCAIKNAIINFSESIDKTFTTGIEKIGESEGDTFSAHYTLEVYA